MRRNAWALTVTPTQIAHHAGAAVEVTADFIAEGAWSGPFSPDGLLRSTFRCGSGAVLSSDKITLCAPSHSVEPIYCYRSAGRLMASNSLHLIVAMEPGAAPPSLMDARLAALTLRAGRVDYQRTMYETANGTMHRFAFGTVEVNRATLELTEDSFPAPSSFSGYGQYHDFVLSTLASIVANARDAQRAAPYGPVVTTVSGGYDSTACAALGKHLGAREAVTLSTGRGNFSDSGRPTAEALGLVCHEYPRFGLDLEEPGGNGGQYDYFLDADHLLPEHSDFLASIATAEDLFFSSFEPHIGGAIVLTGFHGDKAWDMRCTSGPDIKRGDNSGSGLDEFRKRVGFVNVPVPFIGVDNHRELARINASDEMAAYRVGGGYDRPLPRRIAEDAGVPRGAFGVKKAMGSIIVKNTGKLRIEAFNRLVYEYRAALN